MTHPQMSLILHHGTQPSPQVVSSEWWPKEWDRSYKRLKRVWAVRTHCSSDTPITEVETPLPPFPIEGGLRPTKSVTLWLQHSAWQGHFTQATELGRATFLSSSLFSIQNSLAPGCFPREMFHAHQTGRRSQGRPRMCWWDCIPHLA